MLRLGFLVPTRIARIARGEGLPLPQFVRKRRGVRVVVAPEHLHGLVPGHCGQLDDVGQLRCHASGSGVPQIMELQIMKASLANSPVEGLVQ